MKDFIEFNNKLINKSLIHFISKTKTISSSPYRTYDYNVSLQVDGELIKESYATQAEMEDAYLDLKNQLKGI